MAKMFYSVAETAEKLGKSDDEIRQMAETGQLEEFREGDDLVFKAEQIDLLASANEDLDDEISLDLGDGIDLSDTGLGASGMIGLADSEIDLGESSLDLSDGGGNSAEPIAMDADEPAETVVSSEASDAGTDLSDASAGIDLSDSGGLTLDGSSLAPGLGDSAAASADAMSSGVPLDDELAGEGDAAEQTGISIFADDEGVADASADTFVGDGGFGGIDMSADQLESVGSGSGLMDLTREGDDTSLGVDLLDDAYSGAPDASGLGVPAEAGGALFESAEPVESDLAGAAPGMAAAPIAFDGPGSGLVLGLSIGAVLSMLFVGAVVVLDAVGVGSGLIFDLVKGLEWVPAAALAGITLVSAALGFVLMKKS
ncbi:MAG: helix-turn-helix domain-containing protein [Planctomycetota bacterium]